MIPTRFELSGRLRFQLQAVLTMLWSGLYITVRRLLRGPRLPSWSLFFEASSHFQKAIYQAVYRFADINEGRVLLDALVVPVPSLKKVRFEPVQSPVIGDWIRPAFSEATTAILYCHGAYAFYAKAEKGFIADIAVATGLPVFAVDYRLTPEYPFPAQLEDTVVSYDWLLAGGYRGQDLILMGTSAGGNLALALLLKLRDSKRPLPRLVVGFSPWTDIGNSGDSVDGNEPFDILDRTMLEIGARWLVGEDSPRNPMISPIHANLRGLSPIYLQAGGKEIFIDMIRTFYERGQTQGADIVLDEWETMNHAFQAYGDQLPEAQEAIRRMVAVVRNA